MKLKRVAEVRTNFPEADFWLIRRGSPEKIGKPVKVFRPEDIGILVDRTDILVPDFFYYYMTKVWMDGYWCSFALSTTRRCHITTSKVKDLNLPWRFPEEEESYIPWQVDGREVGARRVLGIDTTFDEPPKFPDSSLGEWLHGIRLFRRRVSVPEGFHFLGLDDMLGSPESSSELWHPKEPSPEYAKLYEYLINNPHYCEPKGCFRNAALVALTHPEIEYVEGMSSHIIPVHHAWNLLPDGSIVDCTWCGIQSIVGAPGDEYVGIVVPKEVLLERMSSNLPMAVFDWPDIEELSINPPDWLLAPPTL